MAANGIQPFIHVEDSNGSPIVGAVLKVYEAGTTTLRPIYSDSALLVPMSNPLSGTNASNANGDFPRFYLAPGLYKLRAETAGGAPIWREVDYDYIDTGTSAGSGALPVVNGGTGATTPAAARANLDAASTSDVSALAAQIAAFSSSLQSLQSTPQGRLTPTSGSPVISAGVTAGTAVYYSPYTGNLVPIYDGTQLNPKIFAELTLTLTASHVLNSIYDCFVINDAGTIRIVTGPAWTGITAGSGSRGSGAGTTELSRLSGILVNANAMATARNGATTYSVDAFKGTYVGSIYIDGTAGQITCHTAYGQSRKWSIWNAYNRVPILLKAGDATANWAYDTNTTRAANGSSANSLTIFSGLPEEVAQVEYLVQKQNVGAVLNGTCYGLIGIGVNSTTTPSGLTPQLKFVASTAGPLSFTWMIGPAKHSVDPTMGVNVITALENGLGGTASAGNLWLGAEAGMRLSAVWRG